MENPNFGPEDLRFRDFSKPWYNDRAEGLCINAIESLLGETLSSFSYVFGDWAMARRIADLGKKFNIPVRYIEDAGWSCIELQKLIDALEAQGRFSHSQLEDRYNLLLREHLNK